MIRQVSIINSDLKTNPWTYEIKDLDGEKIKVSLCKKELLLSKLQISYYPEPNSHIRKKVGVVLDLSNYATKKNENMLQALMHLI